MPLAAAAAVVYTVYFLRGVVPGNVLNQQRATTREYAHGRRGGVAASRVATVHSIRDRGDGWFSASRRFSYPTTSGRYSSTRSRRGNHSVSPVPCHETR